jgi:hypothetical protein
MARDESHVVERTDAGADRGPEAIDQESRDARRARPREALLGLLEVEREVARLVAPDAREQLRQHGVAGAIGEQLIRGERGDLVDRAPRHVDGDEIGPRARDHRHDRRLEALRERHAAAAAIGRRMPGGVEEAAERVAVEVSS